jgi:hypothetical protein
MMELLALAVKFGALAIDAVSTAARALEEKLSDEQIATEVRRIKDRAAETKADDWATVQS